jgi:hypothetical protein
MGVLPSLAPLLVVLRVSPARHYDVPYAVPATPLQPQFAAILYVRQLFALVAHTLTHFFILVLADLFAAPLNNATHKNLLVHKLALLSAVTTYSTQGKLTHSKMAIAYIVQG